MNALSGPKGEVDRFIRSLPPNALKDRSMRIAIARSFQKAVMDQVAEKVKLCLKWADHQGLHLTCLVASGGVASNGLLRRRRALPKIGRLDILTYHS